MSRAGYTDDGDDPLAMGRWRAQIRSATRGKRGQQFFRDLVAALDAMPEKELIAGELKDSDGCVCALGALGSARGVDLSELDTEDYESLGATFDIAEQLARETMYENDEQVDSFKYVEIPICGPVRPYWPDFGKTFKEVRVSDPDVGKKRWKHVRAWAVSNIRATPEIEGSPK